jgi:hypothetical protein
MLRNTALPFIRLLSALLWTKLMLAAFCLEGEKHIAFFSFTSKHLWTKIKKWPLIYNEVFSFLFLLNNFI